VRVELDFARTWLSGFGVWGYVLKLPWPDGRPPATARLLLRGRFTPLDGKPLRAEKEIALDPPPAAPGGE
jgi:hypothetical protein